MTTFKELEKQALCPHTFRSKEVVFGQKTGDSICNGCGEIFMPNEEITPPEYRSTMITSGHALMIAIQVNRNLKLVKDFISKRGYTYDWALVDESRDFSLPVHSNVATKAISDGHIRI